MLCVEDSMMNVMHKSLWPWPRSPRGAFSRSPLSNAEIRSGFRALSWHGGPDGDVRQPDAGRTPDGQRAGELLAMNAYGLQRSRVDCGRPRLDPMMIDYDIDAKAGDNADPRD